MDYKRLKEQKSTAQRERASRIIIAVMACIIAVLTVAVVVLTISVHRTKAMYEEALNDRAEMQEEINALTDGKTDVSGNYGTDEGETDIPFVTRGGEELNESGGDN